MAKAPSNRKPKAPDNVDPAEKRRAGRIYRKLAETYPQAQCALTHRNPFELLVATILSAQCTDEQVNKITPKLLERYPDPDAMAQAPLRQIEKLIHSTGFYRNKAKALKFASKAIVDEHGGRVPDTMEQLLGLRGVARKTANVVLGNAFGRNVGVVVDTHVKRLAYRMGLTGNTDPVKIEQDLMARFPRKNWAMLSHLLIWHGRAVCKARKPDCDHCPVKRQCPQVGVK
jgi:endonuclease-3